MDVDGIADLNRAASFRNQAITRFFEQQRGQRGDRQPPLGDDRDRLILGGEDRSSRRVSGHDLGRAGFDQDQRSAAIRSAAHIEAATDARQPLGAANQTQPAAIAQRPGLKWGETDAVVLDRDADSPVRVLDANACAIRFRVADDVGDRFLDHIRDLPHGPGRYLAIGPLLGPFKTAQRSPQDRFGKGASLLQRSDAAFQRTKPQRQRVRAAERVAGGMLQDLQRLLPRVALGQRAANLHQERAERLADLIVHVARESLAFHRELALAPTVAHSLILQSPRDPHDVADPAGDELQDGDALGGQRLTAGLPLLAQDQQALGARPGKEWQQYAPLRGRRKERQPLRFGRGVLSAESQDFGASLVERLRAPSQRPQRPRAPSLARRAMPARGSDGEYLPRVANGDLAIRRIQGLADGPSELTIRWRETKRPIDGEGILQRPADLIEQPAQTGQAKLVAPGLDRQRCTQLEALDAQVVQGTRTAAGQADRAQDFAFLPDRHDQAGQDSTIPAPERPRSVP